MQLKLTWRTEDGDIDLLVSDEQRIIETMQVLAEKGMLEEETLYTVNYVKSWRTKNQIDVLLTYKEGKVYSGDILEIL